MVDITDRLVTLLGLETVKEKQDKQKREAEIEEELAKNEVLYDELARQASSAGVRANGR